MTLSSLSFGPEEAPPLLVLHGLYGSGRNWAGLARRWGEAGWRVHALDLPNHGRSPWLDGITTYPRMAAAVVEWMDDQGMDAAHILGHSMGGKTAMQVALAHGDRVRSLVVADIAPAPYADRSHMTLINTMRRADLAHCQRRAEVEDLLTPAIPNTMVRKFLIQNLVSADDGSGLRWQLNLDGLADSLGEIMDFPVLVSYQPFDGPCLFLSGGASDYVQEAHRPAMTRLFPAHHWTSLPNLGHWLHAEDPEAVFAAVVGFLSGET